MSSATLADLKATITTNLTAARDLAAKAEAGARDLTGEEREQLQRYFDAAKSAKAGYEAAAEKDKSDADLREQLKSLTSEFGLADQGGPQILSGGQLTAGKSFGEQVFTTSGYQEFLKANSGAGGRIPDSVKGINSGAIEFGGLKALVTGVSETSAGALVEPQRLPFVDEPTRPLTIRNLITSGTTTSDTVEYVKQGTRTNNAAPVPEATSSAVIGDGTGGTTTAVLGGRKPESGFVLGKVTETVKTIAHWIPATKRSLSDAGQVRTMIDAFLLTGLEEELEDQIVLGNGVGENFEGILEQSGLTAQAWDTDLLVTTRKAKTKVRTVGRATATAFLFNPEDNERIDLLREDGATGPFMFGGPGGNGVDTLWGLPRVECEALPAGTGMVADWRLAVLWDREQGSVTASDSHADFFVRNLVAFLAELRAAFGILRPAAFVEIDLTA